MTAEASLDQRGRITIHREYRRIFRQRVVQILTPRGILLRPVPETLPNRGKLPPVLTDVSGGEAYVSEFEAGGKADSPPNSNHAA